MSLKEASIQAHVRAIDDCNQRGGRMLSLVDLIDAGTVDLPLAAYLAATMRSGASLLVGARPGGAGKTTWPSPMSPVTNSETPTGETKRVSASSGE